MGIWERLRRVRKGPLAIAGIIAAPLFFCSLMAASLAIARPRVVEWEHAGKPRIIFHQPAASVEARIWLWALVPFGVMIAIGLLASLWRFGAYVSCLGGVVLSLGVTHRVPTWERHHTLRWPRGIDNIPDAWSTDQVPHGAWEQQAATAAFSLSHWTIGLSVAVALVYSVVLYRRMRTRSRIALLDAASESPTAA
jgi:hypothetical protein